MTPTAPAATSSSTCEGLTASGALASGGAVQWCLFDAALGSREGQVCGNNTAPDSDDGPLNISDSGVLYIPLVSLSMRPTTSNSNNTANCSVLDPEGMCCSRARLDVFIVLPPGQYG